MARGWESKAVEAQMEQAGAGRDASGPREASPEVRARRERIESLRLSRARTLAQLERATGAAHREMLERTLRALEGQIKDLS